MRVETPMSMMRPVEAAGEKTGEMNRQGLNPAVMRHEQDTDVQRDIKRTHDAEKAGWMNIRQDDERRKDNGGDNEDEKDGKKSGGKKEEPPIDRKAALERMAAQRLLGLSVDSKKAKRREYKIDITL